MKKLTSILSVLALSTSLSLAVDKGANMDDAFKKMDLNGDGMLSRDELLSGKSTPAKADKVLADHDQNHDGMLTREEYKGGKMTAGKQREDAATAKPATKDGDPGKKDSDSGESKANPHK